MDPRLPAPGGLRLAGLHGGHRPGVRRRRGAWRRCAAGTRSRASPRPARLSRRPTGILVALLVGLLALQDRAPGRLRRARARRAAGGRRARRLPGLDGGRPRLGPAAVRGPDGLGPRPARHRPRDGRARPRSRRAGTSSRTAHFTAALDGHPPRRSPSSPSTPGCWLLLWRRRAAFAPPGSPTRRRSSSSRCRAARSPRWRASACSPSRSSGRWPTGSGEDRRRALRWGAAAGRAHRPAGAPAGDPLTLTVAVTGSWSESRTRRVLAVASVTATSRSAARQRPLGLHHLEAAGEDAVDARPPAAAGAPLQPPAAAAASAACDGGALRSPARIIGAPAAAPRAPASPAPARAPISSGRRALWQCRQRGGELGPAGRADARDHRPARLGQVAQQLAGLEAQRSSAARRIGGGRVQPHGRARCPRTSDSAPADQQQVGVALVGAPEVGVARGEGVAQAARADERAGRRPHREPSRCGRRSRARRRWGPPAARRGPAPRRAGGRP